MGERLSARPEEVAERVESLQAELKKLRGEMEHLRRAQAGDVVEDLVREAQDIDGARFVARRVEVGERKELMEMGDKLREKVGSGAAVLGAEVEGKVAFLAVVSDDLIERGVKAGDLIKQVAAIAGGSGGGRPHLAQAGGKDPAKIQEALDHAPEAFRSLLQPN